MKGNGEAELYAVQKERSHAVTSSIQVEFAVMILDIGRFRKCLTKADGVPPQAPFSKHDMATV